MLGKRFTVARLTASLSARAKLRRRLLVASGHLIPSPEIQVCTGKDFLIPRDRAGLEASYLLLVDPMAARKSDLVLYPDDLFPTEAHKLPSCPRSHSVNQKGEAYSSISSSCRSVRFYKASKHSSLALINQEEIVAHHRAHQLHLTLWEACSRQCLISSISASLVVTYVEERKDCTVLGPGSEGLSSAASPPHFFFFVPVPHALRPPLALCSPLIRHWTVRMDFAVLSQLKKKGLYHIEMPIRFPSLMRLEFGTPYLDFWAFHLSELKPGPACVVPTTGGEHLSIRSRAVTESLIRPKANFNSPNQGSSCVVVVDSYKDIE
ncbi:hypothetical protein ACH5RR_023271 [Cinchona calisaya]|uniref:Uncharacterized protein n=1 Tax=Cinchona calisaya TaxID=153742 RepID=A0ABD2ZBQ0_9GENT